MIQKNTKKQPLNPCPYCDGIAKGRIKTVESFKTIHSYYVMCTECGASTDKYNTEFSRLQDGKFHVLTRIEAVTRVITDWNNHKFNTQTRLLHMSDKERVLWWVERLLSIALYGLASNDSPEFKTGWKLRKIAESRELLKLHSEIHYDLGEVSKVLFNDFHVKDIIYQYLQERDKESKKYEQSINMAVNGRI